MINLQVLAPGRLVDQELGQSFRRNIRGVAVKLYFNGLGSLPVVLARPLAAQLFSGIQELLDSFLLLAGALLPLGLDGDPLTAALFHLHLGRLGLHPLHLLNEPAKIGFDFG